jgi:hypothetical protein
MLSGFKTKKANPRTPCADENSIEVAGSIPPRLRTPLNREVAGSIPKIPAPFEFRERPFNREVAGSIPKIPAGIPNGTAADTRVSPAAAAACFQTRSL